MNSALHTEAQHEKQAVKIEGLLDDIRSGMKDEELLRKHYVTLLKLEKLENMIEHRDAEALMDSHITVLHEASNSDRENQPTVETEESCFICPSCLEPQPGLFDICPKCSVSAQEAMVLENPTENNSCETVAKELSEDPAATLHQTAHADSGPPILTKKTLEQAPLGMPAEPPASAHQRNTGKRIVATNDERTTQPAMSHPKALNTSALPANSGIAQPKPVSPVSGVRCDSCKGRMAPALRDIYDRSRSVQSLITAAICFVLGFVGSVCLSLIDAPSLGRLTVFFITGIVILGGVVFWSVGAFMYLAREKVYFCPRCKRSYPRADISYLAAAVRWSSRRTLSGFE